MIISIFENLEKLVFILIDGFYFVLEQNIILNLLINLEKSISCEIGLLEQKGKSGCSLPLPDFADIEFPLT